MTGKNPLVIASSITEPFGPSERQFDSMLYRFRTLAARARWCAQSELLGTLNRIKISLSTKEKRYDRTFSCPYRKSFPNHPGPLLSTQRTHFHALNDWF